MPCPLFDLGECRITPAARRAVLSAGLTPVELLALHQSGDWGELTADDRAANAAAVWSGARILSAYKLATGVKVWVLTEATDDRDRRAATTVLLPDEY